MNCGEKIAQLRKKKRMTQADLGDELSVTYQAVSKWERGESLPDFDTISKIAKIFQVPIAYFEDGIDEIPEAEVAGTASSAQPLPAQADIIGMCVQCGKVVREGEEHTTYPKLICKACVEFERQEAENLKEQKALEQERQALALKNSVKYKKGDLKKRRNIALLVSLIPAVAIFFIFLIQGLSDKKDINVYLGAGAILALFSYTFTSQMIWGSKVEGIIFEICTGGGHLMGMPGAIISLDIESIIFFILFKIVLFFLAIIVFIGSIIICFLFAVIASPLTFIPSLLFYNLKIARINEKNVVYK